ncbi:hypothetical protein GGX14DRAFT_536142 [Mycena pura]|uniref:C2H2-type domain-containing protein n=1 Tax=Mycena pura TaxID=153505 RepID=A0AAD6YBZ8_9AGAR|nr:hypothetical protein GGX14DRAFT_536142 [Mycena pura]
MRRRGRGQGRGRTTIATIPCPYDGCGLLFHSSGGLSNHVRVHQNPTRVGSAPGAHAPSPSPTPQPYRASTSPGFDEPGAPFTEPQSTPERGSPSPGAQPGWTRNYHPNLDGRPCDAEGNDLPKGTPAPLRRPASPTDWSPYDDQVQFRTADLAFRRGEMSADVISELMEVWALDKQKYDANAPFTGPEDLYETIDSTALGDAPWKCLVTEPLAIGTDAPAWARQSYTVWYRDPEVVASNMLDNPELDGLFDPAPYVEVDQNEERRWSDFMSANFAWKHADMIFADDPSTEGAMIAPLIFGADKTTVSIGTGDTEYHPGYMSLGNLHSSARRAHRGGVTPFIFLAIPKSDRKYDNDPAFRTFKRQLYHASFAAVLSSLKPGMMTPLVRRCPDGHFRRVIWEFGPFIADYPEQVQLAGIVQGWCTKCTAPAHDLDGGLGDPRSQELTEQMIQALDGDPKLLWENYGINTDVIPFTNDFPRADIHEMMSPDLLHQIIKGTFKDHLVEWVGEYIYLTYEKPEADRIMDEIDRRIAAIPVFSGLRRFKDGRRFKQWTGDDSKALMKIYLAAIKDLVPHEIVSALSAFLDFCYLVRRRDFDESTLQAIENAVSVYHQRREIFIQKHVRDSISLPRQHSMTHYAPDIKNFGAPYGVCSSITESRHITAVKRPWRRSNRFEALGQMLLTNQRLDKLAASRADFVERGMLPSQFAALPDKLPDPDKEPDEEADDGAHVQGTVVLARTRERLYPRSAAELGAHIGVHNLPDLVSAYINDLPERYVDDAMSVDSNLSLDSIPISVFHSAVATFYAPSDFSGIRGMKREIIRCTPSWRKRGPRRDCAFVVENENKSGFAGMSAIFPDVSFEVDSETQPCALVEWFKKVGRSPDAETGMWIVEPEMRGHQRVLSIVHLDSMLRAAHLIPVFGPDPIPFDLRYIHSLDAFRAFHVNKYIDHHANDLLS